MIWYSGQTALFLILLKKAALAFLPSALSEATLSISAGPVCSSFSAEACAILHALCWSRQHQQACHFSSLLLLSDSPPSFLLYQTLWQIWQELSSLSSSSIRLQWVPGHSFLSENDAADELARRGALLAPTAIPCSLSPLIHSCLISDWRRTVSWKFFDTQIPSISTEALVLPHHPRCVLSRLRCNGHSFLISLGLAELRTLPAAPADTRPRTPLISFCTVQLRTLYAAQSLATLWSRPWGVARLLGLHGLPPCPHPSEGVG